MCIRDRMLTKVELEGVSETTKLPENLLPDIFAADYGKTLNLNALQARIAALQKWYADQGCLLYTSPSPRDRG